MHLQKSVQFTSKKGAFMVLVVFFIVLVCVFVHHRAFMFFEVKNTDVFMILGLWLMIF